MEVELDKLAAHALHLTTTNTTRGVTADRAVCFSSQYSCFLAGVILEASCS